MPYSHKTSEYRDIKNEFDEALLWIVNQQKVKIADTSRLNKYRGDIDLITKSFHKKEIRKLLGEDIADRIEFIRNKSVSSLKKGLDYGKRFKR